MYELRVLNELYDEWFSNKDYWFSKDIKIDTYLCDKYYKYIEDTYDIYESKSTSTSANRWPSSSSIVM